MCVVTPLSHLGNIKTRKIDHEDLFATCFDILAAVSWSQLIGFLFGTTRESSLLPLGKSTLHTVSTMAGSSLAGGFSRPWEIIELPSWSVSRHDRFLLPRLIAICRIQAQYVYQSKWFRSRSFLTIYFQILDRSCAQWILEKAIGFSKLKSKWLLPCRCSGLRKFGNFFSLSIQTYSCTKLLFLSPQDAWRLLNSYGGHPKSATFAQQDSKRTGNPMVGHIFWVP